MSTGFEDNPFADPSQASRQTQQTTLEDYDPFGGGQPQTGATLQAQTNGIPPPGVMTSPQPAVMQPSEVDAPPPQYQPSAAQRIDTEDLRRRQEELDRKAAELQRKEEDMIRQQQNLAASGGGIDRTHNWPPLPTWFPVGPCFYQDFQVEIPIEFQRIVKMAYYLWMFHIGTLFMNFLGSLAYFIAIGEGTVFGLAILYLLLFTPCSFVCWYRPLYKAFRSDSSFNFMVFFFVFAVQCVASIIQSIGFDALGTCGFINSIRTFGKDGNIGAAIIMLLVAIAFATAATADCFMLIRVHRIYRSSGASISKAREEFTTEVMANRNVQSFAADAAASAARNSMSNPPPASASGTPGNRY